MKDNHENNTVKVRVIGVSGSGIRAVNHMIASGLRGVTCIAADTDAATLWEARAERVIQLGPVLRKGAGAANAQDVGCRAAEESLPTIRAAINDADMVIVIAGMAGGTVPVVGGAARDAGALTVGVVSGFFDLESQRARWPETALERTTAEQDEELYETMGEKEGEITKALKTHHAARRELLRRVDCLIVLPALLGETYADKVRSADESLCHAVKGLSDMLTQPGLITLDINDARVILTESGTAAVGVGTASGKNRAREAARGAIASSLLEGVSIGAARGVLVSITCGADPALEEVSEAVGIIQDEAHEDARLYFCTVRDGSMGGEMRVTAIFAGI